MNSSFPVVSARRRAAFTLIELLVAMVVGLLLVVFLVQLFNATLKAWQNGENQNDTYRQARAAMQLMVRDLSETSAPLLSTPTPTPSASPSPSPGPSPSPSPAINTAPVLVLDRYQPASIPPQKAGDEINEEAYCLTTIPNNGTSSLCAVGYFCVWMPDLIPDSDPQAAEKRARAPSAYALMRQFLGSGRPVNATPTPPATPPSALLTYGLFDRFKAAQGKKVLAFEDLYERVAPPLLPDPQAPPPPLSAATELCAYVWDLQFRTADNLQSLPGSVVTAYPAVPKMPTTPASYPAVLPAFVEIRFKALSDAAARQLEGNTAVTRQTWGKPSDPLYQKFIQPGTRQFSVRAQIHGGVFSAATPASTP